jgi:hypothetical protein
MVWENTTVICDETVFNYNAPAEEMSARVSVLVNNEEDMLDTQGTFHILRRHLYSTQLNLIT